MASKTPDCSICIQRHVTTPSTDWCSICEEALCVNCREHHGLAKSSKNHKITPMSDCNKLPQNIQDIKLYCEDHGDKYQLFCQSHNLPICSKCIKDHTNCGDVITLDKITKNANKSTSFKDIIQAINDIEENIRRIRQKRESNVSNIENQNKKCKEHIETVRKKINTHLDTLQADLLQKLSRSSDKVVTDMKSLFGALEQKENQIAKLKELVQNIEANASDLQTFLGMKVIELEVANEETYLNSITDYEFVCEIDKVIQKITDIGTFGSIRINTKPCDVKMVQRKSKEAQVVKEPTAASIHSIRCSIAKTVRTGGSSIRGCSMLSEGKLLFACLGTDALRVLTSSGSFDFAVSLKPRYAVDVTPINDKTVAVTSNEDGEPGISIVNLDKKVVTKFITLSGPAYGITKTDTHFVVCVGSVGIVFVSLEDYQLSIVKVSDIESFSYIAHHNNKLYYSSPSQNTVTCCTLTGQRIWRYRDDSTLRWPRGVQVDKFGNVFVTGESSKNLVIISADGNNGIEIVKSLDDPTGLYFFRSNNTLLLTYRTAHTAIVFDVKY